MSRYRFNQLFFVWAVLCQVALFGLYIYFKPPLWLFPFWAPITVLVMNPFFNLMHIASHNQVSKNYFINTFVGHFTAIFSGFSFPVFTENHLLHHRRPTDTNIDPDHKLTENTPLFLIPFKLWYHDYNFFKSGLWKKRLNWLHYAFDRIIQLGILAFIIFTGNILNFIGFWLFPLLIVGFLTGLFLFFFPHYTHPVVEKWKKLKSPNLWQKFVLVCVYISKYYHLLHHKNVGTNRNYFPIFSFFRDLAKPPKPLPPLKTNV